MKWWLFSKTRLLCTIVEIYFHLKYETTHQMEQHICLKETCDVFIEKKKTVKQNESFDRFKET